MGIKAGSSQGVLLNTEGLRSSALRFVVGEKILSRRSIRVCQVLLIVSIVSTVCGRALADDEFFDRRTSPFETPIGLRARVNFWKDIFSRYGKHDLVVHHRMFPQAVFHVEHQEAIIDGMPEAEKERYLDYREKALKRDVVSVLRFLERGGRPFSRFEQQVDQAMRQVPGGSEKFSKAVNDDLIRVQRGIRERHGEAIRRSGRYLPYIEDIFRNEGVPIEITRLPFIESSFDYEATSSVGAAGIWQFMKGTARSYMTVSGIVDERRDPFISSRAAARYLRDAYYRLGSWPLAVMSYNHGVAGVAKKVSQLGTSDITEIVEHSSERPFGFASTNFFPELLAAIEVYEERRELFPELIEEAPLNFRTIQVPSSQPASSLARRVGVPVSHLASLNLALSSSVWNGRANVPRGYRLLVPSLSTESSVALISYERSRAGEGPRIAWSDREEDISPDSDSDSDQGRAGGQRGNGARRKASTPEFHFVKSGESLSTIALRYQTTVGRFCSVNKCRRNRQVVIGERLRIP
jgi:membrane-bound lytic murein transglycosylase D